MRYFKITTFHSMISGVTKARHNTSSLFVLMTTSPRCATMLFLVCLTVHRAVIATYSTRFNIQQFYVLPTQCIYVFCVELRTNGDYFPIQHQLTGFYNRDLTLYRPVVTICTASLTFNNSTLCLHSVFMCFVWIREQTAIISLYNIN